MKSLFGDNRVANLLMQLNKTPVITVSALASRLNVSERTIRNDIKQINQELQDCAVIEGTGGKYSLRVFQQDRFMQMLIGFLGHAPPPRRPGQEAQLHEVRLIAGAHGRPRL